MSPVATLRVPAVILFLLASSAAAWSQTASTGAIAGDVRDSTGAVLPGVTVEAASPALIEKVRTVVSDSQGQYKIVDLRPGTYSVTFTLPGFSGVKREGIELTTGFTAAVNAELRVGSVEETVTVSGASPVVDVQNVRTQNVLTRDALDALPTFKTYYGMAALTVGVVSAVQDVGGTQGDAHGWITAHGSKSGDGNANWDGMTYNATYFNTGGSGKSYFINQMAVSEITLSTSGMSAETASGGVSLNVVPKDGGNTFRTTANVLYTNGSLQQSNLTDELRSRGLTAPAETKKVYDYGAGFGGRIVRDRLWFYTAHRWWGNQTYGPGNYYNATPNTMFYTPDLSRPAYRDLYQEDHSLRVTWQATTKHKITGSYSIQDSCGCLYSVIGSPPISPEAALTSKYDPYLAQGTWTFPATSRLLFEAGITKLHNAYAGRRSPEVKPTDIAILELSTNYLYNAVPTLGSNAVLIGAYGENDQLGQTNGRVAMSYITGSHAMKVGLFALSGQETYPDVQVNNDLAYQFRNRVPVSLTQYATPFASDQRIGLSLGLYGQDQWTVRRMTLNLGLRFDYLNAYVPAQRTPGGQFVSSFEIPRINDVPRWTDLSPRLGVAYDLFGNSKTAIKGSVGRYVLAYGTDIARPANPANAIVGSASRTWNDENGNYVPDCNLRSSLQNGECGPLSANGFGTVRTATRFAEDVTSGFGVRPYNWQASISLQHELRPSTAVTVGYFRRWFGNLLAQQNLAVTANDFTPYCVTAPVDSRLPGGGGYPVCGLYDVNPSAFGKFDNLVTQASNFGKNTEVFDGVDITANGRFGKGGLLQGGVSTGRTVTDACFLRDQPQLSAGLTGGASITPTFGAALNTPLLPGYCRAVLPWSAQTQVKASAVYPLPWDLQVAATFQNLPGIVDAASFVATNAQIAPSLGRNLAACPATGTCNATVVVSNLLVPNTRLEDRLNQVDIRFTKIVRFWSARVQGMFDIYNLFNAGTVLGVNARYGQAWLQPNAVLGGRLFEFSAQVDF